MTTAPTLLVVDAANVVGSVPDGWWRDRAAATARLRDALVPLATDGVPGVAALAGPLEVLLVVEGAARGVPAVPGVAVLAAERSGDDAVVAAVQAAAGTGRPVLVATADRGLVQRVRALGAEVVGPRAVRPLGSGPGTRRPRAGA